MLQLFVGCSVLSKISVFVHHLAPNETCGCVWSMWGYGETAPRNLREPNVPVLPMYSCSLSIIIYILLYVVNSVYIYIQINLQNSFFFALKQYIHFISLYDLSVMFSLKATECHRATGHETKSADQAAPWAQYRKLRCIWGWNVRWCYPLVMTNIAIENGDL